MKNLNRRKFLFSAISSPFVAGGYACGIERNWLRTKDVVVNRNGTRIAHFTDTHHQGNKRLFRKVIERIHAARCAFAVFTGDLIDSHDERYLEEALELISSIDIPVFGVPGNHDMMDVGSTRRYKEAFQSTGGDWIYDEAVNFAGFDLYGTTTQQVPVRRMRGQNKALLLTHYPATCDNESESVFDLILAGHSHGGQIRMPVLGPLILPYGVGAYDKGLFDTALGKLHVSSGVGYFLIPARFMCPPELCVVTV
jgi:predicted MPP superfamily phosphohydrolase